VSAATLAGVPDEVRALFICPAWCALAGGCTRERNGEWCCLHESASWQVSDRFRVLVQSYVSWSEKYGFEAERATVRVDIHVEELGAAEAVELAGALAAASLVVRQTPGRDR
jgi:hypothetical protein